MEFTHAVRTCFAKYFDFSGRASRSEFWWFQVFAYLTVVALGIVDDLLIDVMQNIAHENLKYLTILGVKAESLANGILADSFTTLVFIPSLAVTARRLHDIGRTGWWQTMPYALLAGVLMFERIANTQEAVVVAILGTVLILCLLATGVMTAAIFIWYCTDSQPGENRFGPHPFGLHPYAKPA